MWPNLRQRSAELERMDDLTIGGAELREALRQLQVINAALGAARPTLEGVARFWRTAGKPTALTVLDVGAGSGDLSRALLDWADRHGVCMQLVLADINPRDLRGGGGCAPGRAARGCGVQRHAPAGPAAGGCGHRRAVYASL